MAIYCIIISANLLNIGEVILSLINISGQNLCVGAFEINRRFLPSYYECVAVALWRLISTVSHILAQTYCNLRKKYLMGCCYYLCV